MLSDEFMVNFKLRTLALGTRNLVTVNLSCAVLYLAKAFNTT